MKIEYRTNQMHNKEDDFLKAVKNGDSKGLREIYELFLPRIRKLVTSNGGSEEDAQDIFQSAILTIYEKSQNENFKLTSKFFTLLYGICRNLWGNRLQKKSFKEVTLSDHVKYSSEENIEFDIERTEEQELFWASFQKLGEDCQKLLRLFFDKEKMEKIAKMMGYGSVSYAKKRKFQCKEKLIEWIKKDRRYKELSNKQNLKKE